MHISSEHYDALQELLSIGVGRAAGSLNQMLEKPIRLHIPFIQLGRMAELFHGVLAIEEGMMSSVQLCFKGNFTGSACLLLSTETATALVTALTGESEDMDTPESIRETTLTEIGNIVLNGVIGTMANILQYQVTYSVPFYQETTLQKLLQPTPTFPSEMILLAQTRFTVDGYELTGDIMLLFGIPDLRLLMKAVSDLMLPIPSHHDQSGHFS